MEMSRKRNRPGLVSTSVLVLAAAFSCAPVVAQEAQPVYTMTVIIDAAHGQKVAAGKYDRAIAKLSAKRFSTDAYSDHTNLCVAYTKTGEIEKATVACEAAVAAMRKKPITRNKSFVPAHQVVANRMYLALALSNLGVLDVVKGESEAAREKFEEAIALDAKISAPKVNIARLARI
jgi:Flp pilus assembly protein TadD